MKQNGAETEDGPSHGPSLPLQSEALITGEACVNCTYSRLMAGDMKVMKCHRKPPVVFMVPTSQGIQFVSDQPTTRRESWCGEYERRSGGRMQK